jgi:hypothetical protein
MDDRLRISKKKLFSMPIRLQFPYSRRILPAEKPPAEVNAGKEEGNRRTDEVLSLKRRSG